MRVIECNECGGVLAADNDKELKGTLLRHMQEHHDSDGDFDADEASRLVDEGAYSATDS
jgi:predicted small metal-binding protein